MIDRDPVLGCGETGLEVYDPSAHKVLINYQAYKLFTPASNTKLFTFYTGEKILGDSIPSIRYCERNDSLYFSGLGDPTLLHPGFNFQPAWNFLKSSKDTLIYVPFVSAEPRFGSGCAWDDYPYDYSAEKSTLPVAGNEVWFHKNAGNSTVSVFPEEFNKRSLVSYNTDSVPMGITAEREEYVNAFRLTVKPADSLNLQIPFKTSDSLAIQILGDTLRKKIIILNTVITCPWRILYSQPRDTVMKTMLDQSDNFLAEQILMSCSAVLYDTMNIGRVIQYALDSLISGLNDKMVWVDGSGLSRYNLQSPDNLVKLLNRLIQEYPREKLFNLLPGYGYGLSNPGSQGSFIYAKSGSMSHVYNLSGYLVSRSGKILIFSMLNNNFIHPVSDARASSGKILEWIRERY